MAKNTKINYYQALFEEKGLEDQTFEVKDNSGDIHYFESEFVVELLNSFDSDIQEQIKEKLIKIDFMNGDITHFIKHVLTGYVNQF